MGMVQLLVIVIVLVALVDVHVLDVLPLPLYSASVTGVSRVSWEREREAGERKREGEHTPRLTVSQSLFDVESKALFNYPSPLANRKGCDSPSQRRDHAHLERKGTGEDGAQEHRVPADDGSIRPVSSLSLFVFHVRGETCW